VALWRLQPPRCHIVAVGRVALRAVTILRGLVRRRPRANVRQALLNP